VSSARDEETLATVQTETRDRYGRLPDSVEQLFAYARLRRLAEETGVLSIDRTPDGIAVKFSEKARISPTKLAEFITRRNGSSFAPTGVLRMSLSDEEVDEVLHLAHATLLELRAND
jgi:transcription-repair coupling factor (superfamily II helicase)